MRKLSRWKVLILTYFAITFCFPAAGQVTPTLVITSPSNETTIQPGSTVQVTVTTSNSSLVEGESILGTPPFASPIQSGADQQVFVLNVPVSIPAGRYYITAIGKLKSGGSVQSAPVSLVLPTIGSFTSLHSNINNLLFDSIGDQFSLVVVATTSERNMTVNSQTLSFVSANPKVASVDQNGIVRAQGVGTTVVKITYGGTGGLSTSVNVTVKGGVRGDLNGDGQVDIDDVHALQVWLNTPANGPNDARDLNHDGKIDALDARILVTLCTYPRCATHP
jgi:hypothetical protein